ncbi:MAG: gluconate 2-dehydrogenase subunit 3 family protein [Pseudomonadales bacterium]|nr:gluconate 2-dehydrogenase subunit 3 family protein [Pseudomonadales bacterium]
MAKKHGNQAAGPKPDKLPLKNVLTTGLSRRSVLGSAMSATTYALLPLSQQGRAQVPAAVLSPAHRRILEAFTERLIPADELGPGAAEAGVATYIDRSLGDWNSAEEAAVRQGLEALDAYAMRTYGSAFAALDAARQDALLTAMEAGQAEGFAEAQRLFNRLHRLTLEGMFSDPYYGGNQNYAGWDLIGYPGAVMASSPDMQRMGGRLPPLHTSAYGGEHDGH